MGPSTYIAVHRHASKGTNFVVRHVWRENLQTEFAALRQAIVKHPIVSMDIEFPGVVARSITGPKDTPYETLRCNVDLLSPIQIAFALADRDGNLPVVDGKEVGAWQFNFRFSLNEDMFATESIDLLERAGVEFDFLEDHGITHAAFGELLISSGLVLEEDVTFVTFHGGFALAYLLKLMTCRDMPSTVDAFVDAIHQYLPRLFDLRYAMQKVKPHWAGGSLDNLGAEFGIKREATMPAHTAGSDAFLALKVYFAMEHAKMILPQPMEGHIYALEFRQKSAPPSPGSVVPVSYSSSGGSNNDELHTPEKHRSGTGGGTRVNYFQQQRA
jgi:CCR4-NOT transcription complex subunit 7/8